MALVVGNDLGSPTTLDTAPVGQAKLSHHRELLEWRTQRENNLYQDLKMLSVVVSTNEGVLASYRPIPITVPNSDSLSSPAA